MADKPSDNQFSAPISVARVQRLFANALRCDSSQFLRREISSRMFDRLSFIKMLPERILDAGCGEGDDLKLFAQIFPAADLLGVDISPAMLREARHRNQVSFSLLRDVLRLAKLNLLKTSSTLLACAEFSKLPLPSASVNMLWSNLSLHWHPQPHRVIREWARVLRTDGLLMFSAFGPDTFLQLREAYSSLGLSPPILPFVDLHDYGDMLVEAGFADPVMDMEKLNITYSSVDKLFADVRGLGGNPLLERSSGLVGRQRWKTLHQAIEQQKRTDEQISLTVEVIYGHAFLPKPKKTRAGESIIQFKNKPF
ncbi:MAG: methyltransferase domain-containing protein [bacterium]